MLEPWRPGARLPRAERASDQLIDQLKLWFEPELRCELACLVAQVVDAFEAALGDERVDPVFEFTARERARYATSTTTGQDRILEQRAWNGAVPEVVTEGHVSFEWAGAFAWTDHDLAGQRGVAGSLVHDEKGAVLRRAPSRSG